MRLDQSVMWEVFPTVVFKYTTYGEVAEEERFFWTTKKTERTESILNYIPGKGYSFKEICLNFGFRKVAVIGTGEKSRNIRVQCPYCDYVQELKDESQKCGVCNKRFYLY